MKAIVPVRDSMRIKIKNSYRQWAKRNYEELNRLNFCLK